MYPYTAVDFSGIRRDDLDRFGILLLYTVSGLLAKPVSSPTKVAFLCGIEFCFIYAFFIGLKWQFISRICGFSPKLVAIAALAFAGRIVLVFLFILDLLYQNFALITL